MSEKPKNSQGISFAVTLRACLIKKAGLYYSLFTQLRVHKDSFRWPRQRLLVLNLLCDVARKGMRARLAHVDTSAIPNSCKKCPSRARRAACNFAGITSRRAARNFACDPLLRRRARHDAPWYNKLDRYSDLNNVFYRSRAPAGPPRRA